MAANDEEKSTTWQAPEWFSRPFRRFSETTKEADRLLHLSINAIVRMTNAPDTIQLVADIDKALNEESDEAEVARRLEDARNVAEFAQREVDRGFPLLHGQAAVSLWSRTEGLVKSALAAWLENRPDALQTEVIRKVRPHFGEYVDRSKEEQFEYLIDLVDEDLGSAHRFGVNRFEALLQPFGLSGQVDDEVQRELFALQQVRHVLVHRDGVADRRLTTRCPWLEFKIGEAIMLDHVAYARMSDATLRYVLALLRRTQKALA